MTIEQKTAQECLTPTEDISETGSDPVHKKQCGVALLTTVLFLFTLSIMGATFLALMQFDLRDFDALRAETEARYLSEAGVNKALWYLNNFTYGAPYISTRRDEALPPEAPQGVFSIQPVVLHTDPFPLTVTAKSTAATVETSILVWQDRPGTPELDYRIVSGSWKHKFVKEP